MPSNITIPPFGVPAVKNGRVLDPYLASVRRDADAIADTLVSGETRLGGGGLARRAMGLGQRAFGPVLARIFRKHIFATDACTGCGLCVETCPTGNIALENGRPAFGSRCCFCARCYNFCPATAIQITGKTRNTRAYQRYKGLRNWTPPRLRSARPASPEEP